MSGSADLEAWLDKVADFADDAPTFGVRPLSESIEDELRSDTGGDGRLSRHRGGGTATVTTTTRDREAEVTGAGSMAVWAILESGTVPHPIKAQEGSALNTPYGPKSMVQHQGMTAKETWTNGVDDGMPRVAEAIEAEWEKLG